MMNMKEMMLQGAAGVRESLDAIKSFSVKDGVVYDDIHTYWKNQYEALTGLSVIIGGTLDVYTIDGVRKQDKVVKGKVVALAGEEYSKKQVRLVGADISKVNDDVKEAFAEAFPSKAK